MELLILYRGEGGLWPPSPVVRMVGSTLVSSEEVIL